MSLWKLMYYVDLCLSLGYWIAGEVQIAIFFLVWAVIMKMDING